jgi:hypothetical protein
MVGGCPARGMPMGGESRVVGDDISGKKGTRERCQE